MPVSGADGSSLGGGDLVGEGLQAVDLPERIAQDPADPGIAQGGFDPGSGLWP